MGKAATRENSSTRLRGHEQLGIATNQRDFNTRGVTAVPTFRRLPPGGAGTDIFSPPLPPCSAGGTDVHPPDRKNSPVSPRAASPTQRPPSFRTPRRQPGSRGVSARSGPPAAELRGAGGRPDCGAPWRQRRHGSAGRTQARRGSRRAAAAHPRASPSLRAGGKGFAASLRSGPPAGCALPPPGSVRGPYR